MDKILNTVKNAELFADIPSEFIAREIISRGIIYEHRKDQFIIEPQQKVDHFGIVLSGKIQILHIFPEGNYSLLSALTQGDILGADLVCTRTQLSPYHAIAAVPTKILYLPVTLLTIPGSIRESWRLNMLSNLLTLISHENMKKEYRLAILSQKGLRDRILTYLNMQSARLQKNSFAISFSREELAAYLCVNRSALSHELSLMQQEGILTFHKNIFCLHNKPV